LLCGVELEEVEDVEDETVRVREGVRVRARGLRKATFRYLSDKGDGFSSKLV
jgi:hypothetical protein